MALAQDVRYTVRMLTQNPGFTIAAVLALALGIGANTAMFSVVDGVLLRPLPYERPDQLVQVRSAMPAKNLPEMPMAAGDYFDFATDNTVFQSFGAYSNAALSLSTNNADPERYVAAAVTRDFFAVFGAKPALGRFFEPREMEPGQDAVVVLSHGVWRDRFGSNPGILGQALILNGRSRLVVGVAPPGFEYPNLVKMWVPSALAGNNKTRRDLHSLFALGRLKPESTLEGAVTQFRSIAKRLGQAYPDMDADKDVSLKLMLDAQVGAARPALWTLLGAVGFVLAIACANVANLLLARGAARQHELAVRAALGAARWTLARQLLTESLVLAVLGGTLGLGIAYGLFLGLKTLAPATLPRLNEIALNERALLFTVLATLVTGFVFGLIPAWRLSSVDLHSTLKERARGTTSKGRLRQSLVVAQVAAALILLAGAGLLLRSFWELRQVDLGFNPEQLLTMRVNLMPTKYNNQNPLQIQFVRNVEAALATLPGVKQVGAATDLPLLGGPQYIMRFEGRPPVSVANAPLAAFVSATPNYFAAMGMRLKRGQLFTDADHTRGPLVCVVNEEMVRRYFANGEDPIGKRLEIGFSDPPNWRQIIGVVEDAKFGAIDQAARVQVFGSYFQQPGIIPGVAPPVSIAVRTAGDPAPLAQAIRRKVLEVDNAQPVYAIQTMTEVVSNNLSQKRFAMLLLGLFAGLALLLAAIGLAGVISYMVTQRTKEIGIRMALGASPGAVLRMIEGQTLRLVALGVGVGLIGAFAATQALSTMLYGVTARDPLTFATVSAALLLVALAAGLWPALRATRIDPVRALREE